MRHSIKIIPDFIIYSDTNVKHNHFYPPLIYTFPAGYIKWIDRVYAYVYLIAGIKMRHAENLITGKNNGIKC